MLQVEIASEKITLERLAAEIAAFPRNAREPSLDSDDSPGARVGGNLAACAAVRGQTIGPVALRTLAAEAVAAASGQ